MLETPNTRRGAVLAVAALLTLSGATVSGCGARSAVDAPSDVAETTVSGGERTAEATAGAIPEGEVASSKGGFGGEESGGSGHAADAILGIRFGKHEGYDRLVVDLGNGRKPAATVPEWRVDRPGAGLLRVELPSANTTAVSDGTLGGPEDLLGGFRVVRAPEAGMFVDVVVGEGYESRAFDLRDPARLVVDFRPTGEDLGAPPPETGGNTVVVEPRGGARVGGALTVVGYSRNAEAMNTIALEDEDGKVLARGTARSNDWTDTWGYFEATLDVPEFRGRGTLRVGAASARDGKFEGAEVPVIGG